VSTSRLAAFVGAARGAVDGFLERVLPCPEGPAARLAEAMRYSVFAGGKRLRPALVLLASELCGGERTRALPVACAVELVHTYSLIHDDLPAMDDDDLRRGRPSCHRAFDEATAILAGDALLTLAFGTLAQVEPAERVPAMVAELARAAGAQGMVGGQMADMASEGAEPTAEAVGFIHRHKTAALIAACARLGAMAGGAEAGIVERLGRFGEPLGLAFQIADDALDLEATGDQIGKTQGKDASSGKVTYPAVYGIGESRRKARSLVANAVAELAPFGSAADLLRDLADYVVERKH